MFQKGEEKEKLEIKKEEVILNYQKVT